MKLLKKLKDNSVQLIITSPPYNIGKSYEKRIPLNEYIEQQEETLIECYRVLKDKGSLCWQVGNYIDWKSNMTPLDIPIFNICNDSLISGKTSFRSSIVCKPSDIKSDSNIFPK